MKLKVEELHYDNELTDMSVARDKEGFWTATDEETRTLVEKEYKTADACSRSLRKKLSKAEEAKLAKVSGVALEDLIQQYMNEAAEQQERVKKGTNAGARAERGISKFLDNFNSYVQVYGGVVDILKGAGLGGGEAAYGALRLFLVTAVNKEKTEEFIDKMLVELRQHYARIKMLKHVYLTDRMKEYTAVLYRLGVEFLHESVRYYSMGTFRRLGHLIARPPKLGVEKKVQEIKDAIRETEREMRALDGRRLNDIEQVQSAMERKQQEAQRSLGEVSTILNSLQIRTDNDRLDILRRLLRLDTVTSEFDSKRYERNLNEVFDFPRKLPALDVEAQVFANWDFIRWRVDTGSSLFLLHGATVAPDQTAYSWLSPAAVEIVSNFDALFGHLKVGSNINPFLAHHLFCSPDTVSSAQKKISPVTIISTLIYQILKSEGGKPVIRDEAKYAFLKQSLDALEDIPSTQITARCRSLNVLLGKLLLEAGVECLVVVIDRIDRLQGGTEKAVEMLISLIRSTKVTVKVFMTARARALFDDADVKEQLEGRYARLTLNQED